MTTDTGTVGAAPSTSEAKPVLLVGTSAAEVVELGQVLEARHLGVPDLAPGAGDEALDWPWAAELDRWRVEAAATPESDRVVVAVWPDSVGEPGELADTSIDEWLARAEVAIARWFGALGVAVGRCRDDGVVVAVIERPPPLDCAGWGPETGVADAVEAMIRSLARAEGGRGVRVNAVTTPLRLHRPPVVDPAPPLSSFPGTIRGEVAGAVALLLDHRASGLTGTVLHADGGRSWR